MKKYRKLKNGEKANELEKSIELIIKTKKVVYDNKNKTYKNIGFDIFDANFRFPDLRICPRG